MMLTAMIFASNAGALNRIQRRCVSMGDLNVFRSPEYRPSPPDMVRMINSYGPELALIEFYDPDDARKVEEVVHASCPNLAIVGFADNWRHESLVRTTGGYLRVVSANLEQQAFEQAILGAVTAAKTPGPENVIVFMPAKAGSGASTVALNVAGALANKCARSTILIEADLHSGPAGMYLNLDPKHSIIDALMESDKLDDRWIDLITPVGAFSILPACNIREPVPETSPWAYRRLIAYTRPRYEFVIFDLPEVVDHATEAIVTSARTVYVVCTPEVPSLKLARKRCAGLIDRGVPEDRVQVVLNRSTKDGPDSAAIAEILGYRIAQVIPNDYRSLWDANLHRRLVDDKSIVGRAFESFAWSLTGRPEFAKPGKRLFGLFPAA